MAAVQFAHAADCCHTTFAPARCADVGGAVHREAVADEKRVRVATDDAGLVVSIVQGPKCIAVGRPIGETNLAVVVVASSEPREEAESLSFETTTGICVLVCFLPIAPLRHNAPCAAKSAISFGTKRPRVRISPARPDYISSG